MFPVVLACGDDLRIACNQTQPIRNQGRQHIEFIGYEYNLQD
jgi:hypothetical protein